MPLPDPPTVFPTGKFNEEQIARQPPTGTVTFLFTDIEGSTKLWQDHPTTMGTTLARHDQILRHAIVENSGYIFKTIGDAFCAAFSTAPGALGAALAAQKSLAAEAWELPDPLVVRIALHTGSAEERGGDYFGQPLNRVARLLSAGHGGQTLLSLAAQELTRDVLPPCVSLYDLGECRLKDLGRPEHVFQLLHPDLRADFPPLRTLDSPGLPNNLTPQVTSFIGREKELDEIKDLLTKTRLLTLTGAGGCGKTRLSLQAAADLLMVEGVNDGVWLVELAPLSDPALVTPAVAHVLGVKETAGQPIQQTLMGWLKAKRLLLILDNCEHMLTACAALAADVLRSCPNVHILASSREPLNVGGERVYRIPHLSSPDPKRIQSVAALSQFEAVRLFIERAQAVQPAFIVTEGNAPAVAQVCFHLDGVPLAIELAAARVRTLSVEEVNSRLDHRFRLLTGGARDRLPRQQTLRALVDWSYDLLTEQEKAFLCRLSVFSGGWTLSAAEAVCVGDGVEDFEVIDLLTSLADKSLVVYEDDGARYRLLETICRYGQERLKENGEETEARRRHLTFFLALAEEAEPQLLEEDQQNYAKRLQVEADNMRVALTQSLSDTQVALRLAGALTWYWCSNSAHEGRMHMAAALSLPGASERTAARAKALIGLAFMSDAVEAQSYLKEGLSIARELDDKLLIVWGLLGTGDAATRHGDPQAARAPLTESLALSQTMGYWPGTLWSLNHLGSTEINQGHAAEAQEYWECAVALARAGHFDSRICWTLNSLANLNREAGRQGKALALATESLALVRAARNKTNFWWTAEIVANLLLDQGEFEEARSLLLEGKTFRKTQNWEEWIHPQIMMVRACLGLGDYDTARFYLNLSLGMVGSDEIGWLQQYQGDVALGCLDQAGARRFYRNSLRFFWERQDRAGMFLALSGLSATEEAERAARLHGAAQVLSETDDRIDRILMSHRRQRQLYADALAVSQAAFGEEAFNSGVQAGRAMPLEQVGEYALQAG